MYFTYRYICMCCRRSESQKACAKVRLQHDGKKLKMSINESSTDKCRLCLSEYDKSDLTSVYTITESMGISLAARIMICLSLPVQPKDSFPDCVCKSCENRVTQFYAFRENCLSAYYSLLHRSTPNNADEKYCAADEHFEDNVDARYSGLEQVESRETECETKQNASEDFLVPVDHDSTEYYTERTRNTYIDSVSNFEGTSARSQEPESENKIVSCESASKSRSPIFSQISNERTNDHSVGDNKLPYERNNVDDSADLVKYKCLRCDDLFSDLDTASIHCAQCSQADENEFVDREARTSYFEENSQERRASTENPEDIERIVTDKSLKNSWDKSSNEKLEHKQNARAGIADRRNFEVFGTKTSRSAIKEETSVPKAGHACQECESVFSSPALLRRHSVVHTGIRPYECPICKKRFSQLGQLNFHKNFHDNPRYRCDVCKKPFLRPSDIAKHMRTHTGEKPYGCAVCTKSFAQLIALQQHERIHTGDKPYVCEICGKRFSQKANKTKHVKIHKEGTKPHTCDLCGRSFSDLEEMNLHRDGHGGGKPRKCSHCDERFRKMSELSQHTRRYHTFDKPHKCAFCQKAFYSLYNLKQHVMVHTGQKPYACSHCDLKFTQKGNLTKHYERKHATRAINEQENRLVAGMEDNVNDQAKEREIWMLANDLLKNTNDSLIIEREETVEVETFDNSTQ